jgi:ABC-2 type transport system permease protein
MRRSFAITLRHLYLMKGSVSRLVPIFAWITIDLILWGFITRYLGGLASVGFSVGTALLSAVVCWGFFGRVMHGVNMAFFEDIWARNFLNVFASPISITEYITGLTLSSIITSVVALIVLLLASAFLFDLSLVQYGGTMALLLFTLFLFGIALGIVGCAIVLRFGPPAEWFIWPIPALIAPFAGVFYPQSVLPEWMQAIAQILPPTNVFENLRALITGQHVAFADTLPALGLAAGQLLLAGLFFSCIYRLAVRRGLIARYSAESMT